MPSKTGSSILVITLSTVIHRPGTILTCSRHRVPAAVGPGIFVIRMSAPRLAGEGEGVLAHQAGTAADSCQRAVTAQSGHGGSRSG
jgi:hypothetical protein